MKAIMTTQNSRTIIYGVGQNQLLGQTVYLSKEDEYNLVNHVLKLVEGLGKLLVCQKKISGSSDRK